MNEAVDFRPASCVAANSRTTAEYATQLTVVGPESAVRYLFGVFGRCLMLPAIIVAA